jgi:hypothetical protein
MQPAFDLRPLQSYGSNAAILGEGTERQKMSGKECVVFKTNIRSQVEWPVATGVADIYSFTLKYYFGKQESIRGKWQLIGAGNTMMLEEEVKFTFTRTGKWNQFTINSGTMINAGNYLIRLVVENADGLAVSGIDLQ